MQLAELAGNLGQRLPASPRHNSSTEDATGRARSIAAHTGAVGAVRSANEQGVQQIDAGGASQTFEKPSAQTFGSDLASRRPDALSVGFDMAPSAKGPPTRRGSTGPAGVGREGESGVWTGAPGTLHGGTNPSRRSGLAPEAEAELLVAEGMMAVALGRRAAAARQSGGRKSLVQLATVVADAQGLAPGRGITPPTGVAHTLICRPFHILGKQGDTVFLACLMQTQV